jgi:hopanoid biosynthesis associated radical SAM protein HpnH
MPVPVSQITTVASYIVRQKLAGRKRYPLVLMLEPLYQCNLACAGCGKIQYPKHVLQRRLSAEECLRAVDECGAPIVSIPGGEPLLHPEIAQLVEGLVARGKYIYLCTNAILLEEKLDLFEPSRYLSFSVHLDGDREVHDGAVCREGVYDKAVSAIRAALARGFRVTTNTTLFDGVDPDRTAAFFDEAMALGVEGMMISPGYSYDKAPDQEHFLARERTVQLFRRIFGRPQAKGWRFNQSPLFLEFLTGARDYECTPWGMPAYSVFGWQKPCYLLQDGYAKSYDELLSGTEWSQYGPSSGNPACRDCMVHSGFEASSVEEAFSSWGGFVAMARAALFGPRVPKPDVLPPRKERQAVAVEQPTRGWAAEISGGTSGAVSSVTPDVALRTAFEYRGDATLTLDDGSDVEGFVSRLTPDHVAVLSRGESTAREIDRRRIRRVELSGRDAAIDPRWQARLQQQQGSAGGASPASPAAGA